MTKTELLKMLTKQQALKEGHFLLTSGRHSSQYLQCALVLQDPAIAAKLCQQLIQKITLPSIELVVGPAIGGIVLAYEMARQLGALAFFTEREKGIMTLRRGFTLPKGARILVVEDVVTTGGSVRETLKVVEEKGEVVGVAALVDRSNGQVDFPVPFYSLLSLEVVSYLAEACPLCQANLPLTSLGSRRKN